MANGSGGGNGAVWVALIGLVTTVSGGVFAQWDRLFPPKQEAQAPGPGVAETEGAAAEAGVAKDEAAATDDAASEPDAGESEEAAAAASSA